jgi:hypothetical protein
VSAYTRQLSAAARQYESESAFDEAEEARDEWIDEHADLIANGLLKNEDFVREALADETEGAQAAILQDVGRFFARFHATNDERELLAIAVALYREVKPYVDAAAKARGRDEATKTLNSMEAA